MEEWCKKQSLKYVMGGKSFEKALMLGDSLLKGSQVVCLQVLLHLSQVLVRDILQCGEFRVFTFANCSRPPLASLSPILVSRSCVAWKSGLGGLKRRQYACISQDKDDRSVLKILSKLATLVV